MKLNDMDYSIMSCDIVQCPVCGEKYDKSELIILKELQENKLKYNRRIITTVCDQVSKDNNIENLYLRESLFIDLVLKKYIEIFDKYKDTN